MSTPVSGSDPFCTGMQFLDRYDVRTVAECLPDTNSAMDTRAVASSTRLNKLLMASSGRVEAAALMGGKYTVADLEALADTNMGEWLAGIVADLTAPQVLGRRFVAFPDFAERLREANAVLQALEEGKLIFGLQEVVDAGLMGHYQEVPSDVEARHMITYQMDKFFGVRANRNIPGPHIAR